MRLCVNRHWAEGYDELAQTHEVDLRAFKETFRKPHQPKRRQERFVSDGAYVFVTGRRQVELDAAVKDIAKNVIGVQGDVSNLDDLDRLFAPIKQEKGKLDILFANTGVAKYAPLGGITPEIYDSIFNVTPYFG